MRAYGHEIYVHGARDVSLPVALCVHSSGQNHRQWRGYRDGFRDLGYAMHAMDLIGCGKSEAWRAKPAPFHFSADVGVLVELVRALDVRMLVGHSYGGGVAMLAAIELGDELERLCVFDPVLWGLHYELHGEERMMHMAERGFFDERARGSEDWMSAFVDYWQGQATWQHIPEPGRRQMMADASQTFDQARSVAFDWTPQRSYASIRARTLVVSGEETPPEMIAIAKRAADGAGGEHRVVRGGHLTPLVSRERFQSAIAAWCAAIREPE